jgi:ribose transport system substrate-binding protein
MAANDSMALGVVKALDAAKRNDIKVVGFDNLPAIQPEIKAGKVLATVDQFGSQMAAMGIDKALEVVAGSAPLTGWVKTDLELITADKLK